MGQNRAENLFFCYSSKFRSVVFLDIAQDCSLGQCLKSRRNENVEMIFSVLNSSNIHSNLLVTFKNDLQKERDLLSAFRTLGTLHQSHEMNDLNFDMYVL